MLTPDSSTGKGKQYLLRDEPFGYTLYDKRVLRHTFVARDDIEKHLWDKGIIEGDVSYWPAKRTDGRLDIVYSPVRIYYETTLECNLRCVNCFNSSGIKRPNELTTDELLKSLHDFREANVLDLRFTGGELTQRPDWYQMLKTAKDLGFGVSCNTDGIYDDPKTPERFAELDIDQVTLSIDGQKEAHELNRGPGTYDKTVATLKRMHELGVKLRINSLITKASLNDLEPMVDLADQYATEINFFITRLVGRGVMQRAEKASFEEFYEMSLRAEEARARHPRLSILHFEQATIMNSSRSGFYDRFGLKMGPPDGTTRCNVIHDGSFFAGGYIPYVDRSYRLGNVRTDNIFDIWQASPRLEEFRDQSRALEQFCSNCDEFGKRCPGPNFELERLRQKMPDLNNPYCFYGDGPSLLTLIEEGHDRP